MSEITIMHLLKSNQFSGAENVVCQIVKLFEKDENIRHVYCSRDGSVRKVIEANNIEFFGMEKFSIYSIKNVLKELKPDIIHAHDMHASFMASLCAGKIPVINHIHNNNYNSRKISLKSFLYWFAAKKAKYIFWVSNSSYEGYIFHKFFSEKSFVLNNIIDIDSLKNKVLKDQKKYLYDIVFLGRLTFQKNPQRLIDIFEKILIKNSNVQIAIVGSGELEEEIKNKIENKHLNHNVTMLGFQENPYKLLYNAKVMVISSRWEGTPMCALEAMSLGIPIVSTPTDGLCDVIEDGVTGFLSNDDDEIAEYCNRLILDNNLWQEMSKASVDRIHAIMNKKKYKEVVEKIYLGVIKRGQ